MQGGRAWEGGRTKSGSIIPASLAALPTRVRPIAVPIIALPPSVALPFPVSDSCARIAFALPDLTPALNAGTSGHHGGVSTHKAGRSRREKWVDSPSRISRKQWEVPPALARARQSLDESNLKVYRYRRENGDLTRVNDVELIEKIVHERSVLRAKEDWDAADELRRKLKEEHNVSIYDKDFTWFVGNGSPDGQKRRETRSGKVGRRARGE